MSRTRWAILGPGAISNNFADSLAQSSLGVLHAVGSSDPHRAAAFARNRNVGVSGTYRDVLARDDVDAVYVGTVHTTHAELAIAALEAGKAVLCEKPVSPAASATEAVLAVAAETGRPFLEAYKFRFGPLAAQLRSIISGGGIGELVRVEAGFGFAAAERSGRLFDPALAGGAILDVGGYPVSLAVGFATAAGLIPGLSSPKVTASEGGIGPEGVDEWASATITMGAFVASVRTSIVSDLPRTTTLEGTEGTIELPNVWGSRSASGTVAVVRRTGEEPRTITVSAVDPMAAEADALCLALAGGRVEVPEMTWAESSVIAHTLDDWRRGLA